MPRTFFALIMLVLAAPAFAIGKVTVDPNAPGVLREDQTSKTDSRLDQKVTLVANHKCVSAIFDQLSQDMKVTLKAGYNNNDWQVRDRKMNIFAKDVPLTDLMSSIARVMKFKWSHSGEGNATVYRLYMDRQTLLDTEAQRARAEEKAAAEYAAKRANALAKYGETGSLSAVEMEKLKTVNPVMYIIAQSGMGESVASFFNQVSSAAEALAFGRRLDIDARNLSPAAWASLLKAARAELGLESRFSGSQAQTIPDDLDPAKVSVIIDHGPPNSPDMVFLLGELCLRYDNNTIAAPILDPDSAAARMIGKVYLQAESEGRDPNDLEQEHRTEFEAAMAKEAIMEVGGELVNEHPNDPDLEAKVTLKPETEMLAHVQQTLAEQSCFAVVSDSFSAISFPLSAKYSAPFDDSSGQKETTIRQVLDYIEEAYLYNWDKRHKVIELRDRDWIKKRASQIPEAWLDKWRRELIKTGTLDIDNLAEIAQLTQEQINVNVSRDKTLKDCSSIVQVNRELLNIWTGLRSDQRAAMLSKSGLNLALLSNDQCEQTRQMLFAIMGAPAVNSDKPMTITCERKADGKAYIYIFRLLIEGESEQIIAQLDTPRYSTPVIGNTPVRAEVNAPEEKHVASVG